MIFIPKSFPFQINQFIAITGLCLMLPGLPLGLGFICNTLLLLVNYESNLIRFSIIGLLLVAITAGTGGTILRYSSGTARGKILKPFALPSIGKLISTFWFYIGIGIVLFQSDILAGLILPPTILIIAAIPPFITVSWVAKDYFNNLTLRRGLLVFTGSATVGLLLGGSLLVMVGFVVAALVFGEITPARADSITVVFNILRGRLNSDFFNAFLLIQIMLIYPLVIEFVKPLITLPMLNPRTRQESFLLGSIAGAGFATLETIFLIGLGYQFWAWILIIQFAGGAVHPLATGWVTLGWQDVLKKQESAGVKLLAIISAAVTLHALRNAGFLAIYSLAMSYELDTITRFGGLVVGGILLLGLTIIVLWAGRSIIQQIKEDDQSNLVREGLATFSFNQAIAIWSLACLLTLLPVGLISIHLFSNK